MNRWVVLVGFFVLLVGCGPGEVFDGTVTGQQGVVLSQVQVPQTIYAGEEFSLTYELANKGAVDVLEEDPGHVSVSFDNLYLQELGVSSRFPDNLFWLNGRTRYFEGDDAFVNVHFRANDIERFSNRVSTAVLATVCYPYESRVVSQVCIGQDRATDQGSIVCRNTPVRPSSPAAPIGVDSIEVRPGRNTVGGQDVLAPQFRLSLRNYQGGIPSTGACGSGASEELNFARISASLLNERLECESSAGEGIVRFSRNTATVVCRLPADSTMIAAGQANFLSLLSVDLEYTYRESSRTELVVQR